MALLTDMLFRSRKFGYLYLFAVLSFASFLIFAYYISSHTNSVENIKLLDARRNVENIQNKNVREFRLISSSQEKPDPNIGVQVSPDHLGSALLKGGSDSIATKPGQSELIYENVHIFYYPWYKNPQVDGVYAHWDHELLPHWSDKTANSQRRRKHTPPDDIGANYYPKLGPYSSKDPNIVKEHMRQISSAGVGVIAVSWYPPQYEAETQTPVDSLMPLIFDTAKNYSLKVVFHIEPYRDRSGATLKEVMKYIIEKYGNHPAFYRTQFKGKSLPLVYVYDSYQIEADSWAEALSPQGKHTIRGTEYDAVVIGLLVERQHFGHLTSAGFDGFYTYFASNGFSYGSTWSNWPFIAKEAAKKDLLFIPSIGPGYFDTQVRPWNAKNTKLRMNGKYYRGSFESAMRQKPQILSITSFNEWHEGTQVEPAVPKVNKGYRYEDYLPRSPGYYLELTKQFVGEYYRNMTGTLLHDDAF